ncbi:uncharacterized protein LOC125384457 [Haliotis rufescens]|uniref:uncharacterized protein LOC125384457 n=1 Tax=Haliotis rufescens TaxID=6454 RepID=UPI00201F5666|nr:uncharacterized protein LOC125384457 [Haliotis rufescens]
MDVPSHLLQPLSIDTNIVYDLDTTKFPGLDHPQHMYHPALLVTSTATRQSWLSALKHDDISEDLLTDDLFDLIENCFTENVQHPVSSDSDSTLAQSVFDDIIDSTSSDQLEDDFSLSDVTWFQTDSCATFPCPPSGQQVHPSSPCWDSSCVSSTCTMSLKRKRESDDLDLAKRSKLDDLISSWICVPIETYDMCVRGF